MAITIDDDDDDDGLFHCEHKIYSTILRIRWIQLKLSSDLQTPASSAHSLSSPKCRPVASSPLSRSSTKRTRSPAHAECVITFIRSAHAMSAKNTFTANCACACIIHVIITHVRAA